MTGASRPSIVMQVDSLGVDLMVLKAVKRDDPRDRGVALATAHAVLILAVSPAIDEEEMFVREDILADALAALERVGFGHIRSLVAAARSCDVLAASIARGVERLQ